MSTKKEKITSPIKAIRANCLKCCHGSSKEIELCPGEICPLYPFRLGKNPYRKPIEHTAAEKEAMRARMAHARAVKQSKREEVKQ